MQSFQKFSLLLCMLLTVSFAHDGHAVEVTVIEDLGSRMTIVFQLNDFNS